MKITSRQWYFWRWILYRWPYVRGYQWIQCRKNNAFVKWKTQWKEGTPL